MTLFKIVVGLVIAVILQFQPLSPVMAALSPQWVCLIVIYWVLEKPQQMSLLLCLIVGLIVDVLSGSLLGVHGCALALVAYVAHLFAPRINMFMPLQQLAIVFLLCLFYVGIIWGLLAVFNEPTPMAYYWLSPLPSAMIWMLFARFRRKPQQINYYGHR